jgi:hypothetical protein
VWLCYKQKEACQEALLDPKAVASRATWDSTIKRQHQDQQLKLNRAKVCVRTYAGVEG